MNSNPVAVCANKKESISYGIWFRIFFIILMEAGKVQMDHKTLLRLSKKPYDTISRRFQSILLLLKMYNIVVECVPGNQLIITDDHLRE